MPRSLATLPKAELHLHIEGTLEPELAFDLALENGVTLPFESPEALRDAYEFDDLQSFLDVYYATMAVLRTPADFRDLAVAYLERAAAQGVVHVEPFFDPQAHLVRGVALEAVLDGLTEGMAIGRARWGISGGLIMCFLRDRPPAEASQVLEAVLAHGSDAVIGVGLDSAEVGHPPGLFEAAFARAADAGLHRVAHAGEEAPASYIVEALDVLGVERIDHGVRAIDDPAVVARLVRDRIPLTLCPLSNKRLQVTPDLARHPFGALLAAGVRVTINSDDPSYFGGYVGDNYEAIRDAAGLSDDETARVARTSIEASFASAERVSEMLRLVDAWAADAPAARVPS